MERKLASTLLLMFCLAATLIKAQQNTSLPPAKRITSFPFTMLTGGIIIIQATLDGYTDSLNFVLDTGSGGISLDSATCDYFKLKRQKSARVIRGIAGMRAVDFVYDHTLHMPGLTVDKLDFHINDYEILTSVYGLKIDGIIGYSFFRKYIVTIDYDKMRIDIFTPGAYKYPRGGHLLNPQFSTLPMQALGVRDARLLTGRFYFDTGAGLCMLFSEGYVKDSLLLLNNKKIFETQAEGLGGKASMKLTVIKEVKLGPYKFKKVPVYIFNDEYNVTSYPLLGGLIGNDILRRFNVVLNYAAQQIFIKPNNHYQDSFDYSYTGLGIYLIDGNITVTDIMKNSPAEKAGFKEGDIVLGVNNNFSANIQTYKAILQNVKAVITVLIKRGNGELFTLTMRVNSIR